MPEYFRVLETHRNAAFNIWKLVFSANLEVHVYLSHFQTPVDF